MTTWHPFLKVLHWTMAAALLAMVGLGLLMTRIARHAAETGDFSARVLGLSVFDAYQLHKSIGVLLFALVLLRLGWRLAHPGPALPATMPRIERLAAQGIHVLLYGLMLSMPITGWLLAASSPLGIPTIVFGILTLPHPLNPNAVTEATLSRVHFLGGLALLTLASLHVAAALKHHFIDQDDVLRAMLPRVVNRVFDRRFSMMLVALLTLAVAGPASAQPRWLIDQESSRLTFALTIGGAAAGGGFADWSADILFDPDLPGNGSVRARIGTGSVYIDAEQAKAAISSPAWLNAAAHPDAVFEASGLDWDGTTLTLPGVLTLKDASMPLALTGTLVIEGPVARATVSGAIRRDDFGIGDMNAAVASAVTITVDLVALRAD